MAKIDVLLEGYKRFHAKHFLGDDKLYARLAEGQMPKALLIGCSDSRVDPSILMDADPGDIFVIRNVANLAPPYQPEGESYHGTSAALEFAVNNLKVEHIVVMGHSGCAGIKALVDGNQASPEEFSFLQSWVNIARDAKERTLEKCQHSDEDKYAICEKESIITSIHNLLTFPWLKEKVDDGSIELHGWYFSLSDGKLYLLSEEKNFEEANLG